MILQLLFLLSWQLILAQPRVSIITSVYNADEFIEHFLEDITRQTIFKECEVILINPASPGNEDAIIQKYLKRYSNIVYRKLDKDPGLYAVWNMAIRMAKAPYVTNANTDDRHAPQFLQVMASVLDKNSNIDLIYADYYMTEVKNGLYENARSIASSTYKALEFSMQAMRGCLPGAQPMWRKSMHIKYGYFDESFLIEGDYEMWLRAATRGARFKHVPQNLGLILRNTSGLSLSPQWVQIRKREHDRIRSAFKKYLSIM